MAKASQRQFLVKVGGLEGFWATKTGGNPTSEVTKAWDGGSTTPDVLTSPADHEDLTVGRPYDLNRDGAVVQRLRTLVGRYRTTISVQPTDGDLVRRGRATTFHGTLVSLSLPEVDAGSSDVARVELTFAIERVS